MTLEEIKEAVVGKEFYYWEIDTHFSKDEHCEVIRDIKLNGEYNPYIVFDDYDFDFLPLDEIERLAKERKIEGYNGYIYYECELRDKGDEKPTKLAERIGNLLADSLVGKFIIYKEGHNSDIDVKEVTEQDCFKVTDVKIDLSDCMVSIYGDTMTHILSIKDIVELVDYGVFYEGRMDYSPLPTVKWKRYELTECMTS